MMKRYLRSDVGTQILQSSKELMELRGGYATQFTSERKYRKTNSGVKSLRARQCNTRLRFRLAISRLVRRASGKLLSDVQELEEQTQPPPQSTFSTHSFHLYSRPAVVTSCLHGTIDRSTYSSRLVPSIVRPQGPHFRRLPSNPTGRYLTTREG